MPGFMPRLANHRPVPAILPPPKMWLMPWASITAPTPHAQHEQGEVDRVEVAPSGGTLAAGSPVAAGHRYARPRMPVERSTVAKVLGVVTAADGRRPRGEGGQAARSTPVGRRQRGASRRRAPAERPQRGDGRGRGQGRRRLRRAPARKVLRVGGPPGGARRRVRAEDGGVASRQALGNMKGAMMKLGQMASYLDQGMPEPVRAGAGRAAVERAADERRAGGPGRRGGARATPPERAVRRVGPGADRGGVDRSGPPRHHPRRPGRRRQGAVPGRRRGDPGRPRQRRASSSARCGMLFPGLEPEPLVAELRERLVEELDYRLEADNQRLFADFYRGHPFIHVPEVVDELSHRAGAHHRAGRGRPLRRGRSAGARRSATSPPRRSSASCSAASTASTPSTATRTRATTCSARAAR